MTSQQINVIQIDNAHGFIPVVTIVSADPFCRVNKDYHYYHYYYTGKI